MVFLGCAHRTVFNKRVITCINGVFDRCRRIGDSVAHPLEGFLGDTPRFLGFGGVSLSVFLGGGLKGTRLLIFEHGFKVNIALVTAAHVDTRARA